MIATSASSQMRGSALTERCALSPGCITGTSVYSGLQTSPIFEAVRCSPEMSTAHPRPTARTPKAVPSPVFANSHCADGGDVVSLYGSRPNHFELPSNVTQSARLRSSIRHSTDSANESAVAAAVAIPAAIPTSCQSCAFIATASQIGVSA